MVNTDLDMLINEYYNGKPPKNIKTYFLMEEEYEKKYKQLTKKIFGRVDEEYKGSIAYCIYDKDHDIYHILVKDCVVEYYNAYALTLFHELGHVDTMPHKIGTSLYCSSKKKDNDALIGFEFWKEYIAQYEAVNRFQMVLGEIVFLSNKEGAERVISKLKPSFRTLLYEIVLYSEITGVYLKGVEEETKALVECLKQIRNSFNSTEEMKHIKKKDLDKIGKLVIKLFDAILDEEEKEDKNEKE